MIMTDGRTMCARCGQKVSVVLCDGCGIPLCESCRIFDLWSYGCGHVNPKAFCLKCHEDIDINPWGGKRP
mgnify:FL=1